MNPTQQMLYAKADGLSNLGLPCKSEQAASAFGSSQPATVRRVEATMFHPEQDQDHGQKPRCHVYHTLIRQPSKREGIREACEDDSRTPTLPVLRPEGSRTQACRGSLQRKSARSAATRRTTALYRRLAPRFESEAGGAGQQRRSHYRKRAREDYLKQRRPACGTVSFGRDRQQIERPTNRPQAADSASSGAPAARLSSIPGKGKRAPRAPFVVRVGGMCSRC